MRSLIFNKPVHLKLIDSENVNLVYWLFLCAASICIFIFDLSTPLGVAAGAPYALIVFASLWLKSKQSTLIVTFVSIALVIMGFHLSPGKLAPIDVVLTNRLLALLVILITALMVLKMKKVNEALCTLMTEAYIDPLTQCKNSHAFEVETRNEIKRSKRYKRHLSLAVFDIDHISNGQIQSNTDVGDQYIQKLSSEIRKSIRSSDQLYRIDHHRFVVLYVETGINDAKDACDSLCNKISKLDQQNTQSDLTVNVGVTMLTDKDNLQKLYRRAEDALSIAKENGCNQVGTLPEIIRTDKPAIPAILCRPRSG